MICVDLSASGAPLKPPFQRQKFCGRAEGRSSVVLVRMTPSILRAIKTLAMSFNCLSFKSGASLTRIGGGLIPHEILRSFKMAVSSSVRVLCPEGCVNPVCWVTKYWWLDNRPWGRVSGSETCSLWPVGLSLFMPILIPEHRVGVVLPQKFFKIVFKLCNAPILEIPCGWWWLCVQGSGKHAGWIACLRFDCHCSGFDKTKSQLK